jgi:hypothetical protein
MWEIWQELEVFKDIWSARKLGLPPPRSCNSEYLSLNGILA